MIFALLIQKNNEQRLLRVGPSLKTTKGVCYGLTIITTTKGVCWGLTIMISLTLMNNTSTDGATPERTLFVVLNTSTDGPTQQDAIRCT